MTTPRELFVEEQAATYFSRTVFVLPGTWHHDQRLGMARANV
ncbi:MAG: hypothetical protein ACKV0T_26580 [Planctomycetales bacterium]